MNKCYFAATLTFHYLSSHLFGLNRFHFKSNIFRENGRKQNNNSKNIARNVDRILCLSLKKCEETVGSKITNVKQSLILQPGERKVGRTHVILT